MLMKLFMFNQISLYRITRQAYMKVSEVNKAILSVYIGYFKNEYKW